MKPVAEQTLYEILEVPPDAPESEIVKAWERAEALYGPGSLTTYTLVSPDEAAALGAKLEEALSVLLDPAERMRYDARIRTRTAANGAHQGEGPSAWGDLQAITLPPIIPPLQLLKSAEPPSEADDVAPGTGSESEEPGQDSAGTGEVATEGKPTDGEALAAAAEEAPASEQARPVEEPPAPEQTVRFEERVPPTDEQTAPEQTAPVEKQTAPVEEQTAPVEEQAAPAADLDRGVEATLGRPEMQDPPPIVLSRVAQEPQPIPLLTPAPVSPPFAALLESPAALAVSPLSHAPPSDGGLRRPAEDRAGKALVLPEGAPFTGDVLRRAREARGLGVPQICERTKISRHHLENIEADRYDKLPAPVYLRGILMALARELRLDGQKVARSYLELAAAGAAGRER